MITRVLAALAFGFATVASAAPVTYVFTGTLTYVNSTAVSGRDFHGSFTYDADAALKFLNSTSNSEVWMTRNGCQYFYGSVCQNPFSDGASPTSAFELIEDNHTVQSFASDMQQFYRYQDDTDRQYTEAFNATYRYTQQGAFISGRQAYLAVDNYDANLSDFRDAAGLSIDVGTIIRAGDYFQTQNSYQRYDMIGYITSVSVLGANTVPEPGTLAIVGIALFAGAFTRKLRAK